MSNNFTHTVSDSSRKRCFSPFPNSREEVSCLVGPGHVHAQMPSESPFELVVNNAHDEPTINEATIPVTSMDYTLPLGLYYYYTVEVSSAHFDPFPVAMMITVIDIDPVGLDETLNPDNSTVFSEIEDFTAITELAFDKWAIGHDDFSDQTKRLGTLVIDTELLQGVEPLNLCLLDQDHQPVTALALMNLQDNMDIAAATMSLATAEEGMTGFGKPSRLTMYNLEFEETPGVLYVTDEANRL